MAQSDVARGQEAPQPEPKEEPEEEPEKAGSQTGRVAAACIYFIYSQRKGECILCATMWF